MNTDPHNPQSLIKGIQAQNRNLSLKNEDLQKFSQVAAEKKRDYRIVKAQKILELKSEGQSVTIIKDICNGDKIVAEARFQFDVADGIYKACKESIFDIRASIDSYRSLLAWLKVELYENK